MHPVLFAALYKVLAFLRLDTPWFMVLLSAVSCIVVLSIFYIILKIELDVRVVLGIIDLIVSDHFASL